MAPLRLLQASVRSDGLVVALHEVGGDRRCLSLWPSCSQSSVAGVVSDFDDGTFSFARQFECHIDVSNTGIFPSAFQPQESWDLTRLQIPLEAWLVALTKTLYDRELAVSERRVKPASILRNSSLILGKQIIHILPEGYAMSLTSL